MSYSLKDLRRDSVPVKDGAITIAVIADTHSAPHKRAAALVAAEKPDVILHAGDIGDLAILSRFKEIAPTIAVRGNIDERVMPDAITLDLVDGDESLFTILLCHIAVNGPKLRADAVRLAKAEEAQLVVCGHSHVPFIGRDKNIGVFNPGSIGPKRFTLPIVFGVMKLAASKLVMKHVDCETGEAWFP